MTSPEEQPAHREITLSTNLKDIGHDGVKQWLAENFAKHHSEPLWQLLSTAIRIESLLKRLSIPFTWDATPDSVMNLNYTLQAEALKKLNIKLV